MGISKVVGYLGSSLGAGILVFALLAMADPGGAQLADDHDPFGPPPSIGELPCQVAIGAGLLASGIWLAARWPSA